MDINLPQILSVFATLKVNQTPLTGLKFSRVERKRVERKHLKLLDGIALLAVTEGNHDVAAVTMTNHVEAQGNRTITKFHLIKNRNFSIDEVEYLNSLCDLLNSCVPHRLTTSVQELIVPKCRQKIIARLVKLQKTVRNLEKLIPTWDQPNKEDVDEFKRVYPTAPGSTWPQILSDFLNNGLHPAKFASSNSAKPLHQCLYFFVIGLSSYLRSPQLTRRLRKVSDYAAIIRRISKVAIRERARRSFALNFVSHCILQRRH